MSFGRLSQLELIDPLLFADSPSPPLPHPNLSIFKVHGQSVGCTKRCEHVGLTADASHLPAMRLTMVPRNDSKSHWP